MNVSSFIKKIFFTVIVSFLFIVGIEAGCSTCARTDLSAGDYIVQVGGLYGGYQRLYRQNSKVRVYCAKRGIPSPAYGDGGTTSTTCDSNYNFASNNEWLKIAIGYVITRSGNTDDDYVKKQRVIHQLLHDFNSGEAPTSYDSDLYDAAKTNAYNYTDHKTPGTYYKARVYNCGNNIQPIIDGYTTETIPNKVHIAYHPNGGIITGSLNPNGFIIYNNKEYFHTIEHGKKGDPYNANNTATFNLRRTGYTFSKWKVRSTEVLLDQNIEYDSTVYAQYNDSSKTTANTATVYSELFAQWNEHYLKVNYYNGSTFIYTRNYYYDNNYSDGLHNYSTLGLSQTGYVGKGTWSTSDGKYIVDQNTSFSTGQALAQALGKDLTSGNAEVNIYAGWNLSEYNNTIYHWTWGYKNSEGNNSNKAAFHLGNTSFKSNYGSNFTMNTDRAVRIPNGFYLNSTFGTSAISGTWTSYNMGQNVTQKASNMTFEYDYSPYNYTITYNLDGGTNNSSNPSTYNVLYGVNFSNPTRTNYDFLGWYETIDKGNLEWAAGDVNYSYKSLETSIKAGKTYYITIDKANKVRGNATQFTILIYDFTANKTLVSKNLNFGDNISSSLTCPSNANNSHNIQFLIYAGQFAHTKGNSVKYEDLKLEKPIDSINNGANASFSSADDLYSKLSSRRTGNVTINAKWKRQQGTLKIIKVKQDGTTPIQLKSVTFNIYPSNNCTGTPTAFTYDTKSNGVGEKIVDANLNYSIKETVAPDGYGISGECINMGYLTSKGTLEKKVTNKTQCEIDFEKNSTLQNRIELYKTHNFNNLLNFEVTTSGSACTNYSPVYKNDNGCLKTEQNTTTTNEFTATDLSAFNDVLKYNNVDVGYCVTGFKVEKNLSMPTTPVKAGTLIIGSTANNKVLTGILTKKCYVYGNITGNVQDTESYSDYISSVSLGGTNLLVGTSNASNKINLNYKRTESNGLKLYEGEVRVDYYFNPVCVNKMSGRPSSVCSPDIDENSGNRFIGYGVLSEFQDGKSSTEGLNYSVNFASLNNSNKPTLTLFNNLTSVCNYQVAAEIIKYDKDAANGDLDLEFRIVDTEDPFNRDTNSNWSDGTDSSSKNDVVKENIIDANNSYNKQGIDSIYYTDETTKKIILNADTVKLIREWNDTHIYDDYTYTKHKDGVYTNAFFDHIGLKKN